MYSNTHIPTHSRSGFSILMAIGTIGVLLIIVTSLAISYIRESKLSRYSYDEVLSSTAAEGEFEYAMLKVKNHRDGFQDATSSGELDGNLLDLTTPRSSGLRTEYNILASSTDELFTLSGGQHLIIPLFASTGSLALGATSLSPEYNMLTVNTTGVNISDLGSLSWTIVAMSGSESIAISGTGNITPSTIGAIRTKMSQCYDRSTGVIKSCTFLNPGDEELLYSYDESKTINDFLLTTLDPYFVFYNPDPGSIPVRLTSTTPFTLPTLTITATARKGDSSQVFRFIEDKGRYYDALKYGIYNTGI
ncbi:hypothetical protein H7169_02015 [Candidatus Gracilibacteria bacterium]|nr:hypothetical protein [Candidatus Gracilibacteria bacterium]